MNAGWHIIQISHAGACLPVVARWAAWRHGGTTQEGDVGCSWSIHAFLMHFLARRTLNVRFCDVVGQMKLLGVAQEGVRTQPFTKLAAVVWMELYTHIVSHAT